MRKNSPWIALFALLFTSGSTARTLAPSSRLEPVFAGGLGETRAAILVENGRVTAERYAPGYDRTTRFVSWSMAKTITAVVVGELVADGRLQLDAPAPIAEWQRANDPRRAITLRQLLQMASGLRHTEVGVPVEASDTNQVLFVEGTQAMAARAIAQPLEAKPGAKFEYSSLTTIILSEIVTRALTASADSRVRAQAYRDFVEARLFKPAGISSARLEFDGAGTQVGGSLIYMTLPDYARFGQVLLDGRSSDGTRIVAPDWLAFMKSPSPTNPEYGGQLWLNTAREAGAPPKLMAGAGPGSLVSCLGHLGQFVVASPEQGLVLVRLGKTQDDTPAFDALRRAMGSVVAASPTRRPDVGDERG